MGKLRHLKQWLSALLAAVMIVTGCFSYSVPASAAADSGITLTVIGDTGDHHADASSHTGYVYWIKNENLGIDLSSLADTNIAENCGDQIHSALTAAGITYTESTNLYMTSMTKGGVTLDAGDYNGGYWSVLVDYADGTYSSMSWGSDDNAAQLKAGCRLIYYWTDKMAADCRIAKDDKYNAYLAYDTDAVTGISLYTQSEPDKALTNMTLEAGQTASVITKLTVPAGSNVSKDLTWTSDNETCATVSKTSTGADITAVSSGSAVIKASMVNTLGDTVEASFLVNVTATGTTITSMTFAPDSLTGIAPGDSVSLADEITITYNPTLAEGESAPAISWISANESVATVDRLSGEVTAVTPGQAVMTGSFVNNQGQTVSAAVTVTVSEVALTGISMDRSFVTLDSGKSDILTLSFQPANATEVPDITWESSDPSVLTVTGNAKTAQITGVTGGEATVTAKAGELTASCDVTVKDAEVSMLLKSLTFASSSTATAAVYPIISDIDEDTKECTAAIPENKSSFYLIAELADGVTGTITASYLNLAGTATTTKSITAGKATSITGCIQANQLGKDVTLTVTSGTKTETYVIHLMRESLLGSLKVTDADGSAQYIAPDFAVETTEYTLAVPDTCASLNLLFSANNAGSTVLTINGEPAENGEYTLNLDNTITDAVICAGNENTVPREYHLKVTKQTAYGITFVVDPADAIISVYNESEQSVGGENGVFDVLPGTYTYVVSKTGYVSQTGSVTVADSAAVVEAKLSAAAPSRLHVLDSEWSSFRKDDDNQGVTSAETPTTKETTGLKWENKVGDGYDSSAVSSPILVDGYVYCYAGNHVLKLNKTTGDVVASGEMVANSSFAINPPSYANGMIFVGLSGGRIQAFNAETLESLWVYTDSIGGQPNCSVKYSDGYVYTGFWNSETKDAHFVCLSVTDEDTGNKTEAKQASWTYTSAGGFYWADSLVRGNYVMVGTDDGTSGSTGTSSRLLVFNKTTGKLVQEITGFTGDIRSGISYYNNRIYFTSKAGYLYSYNLNADGTVNTTNLIEPLKVGEMSTSTPLLYGGRCYVGATYGSNFSGTYAIVVIDINSETGAMTQAYALATDAYPQTSGVLTTAYAGGDDGYNYVYFTTNGAAGNLWILKDKAGMTEASSDSGILYSPDKAQYCICSVVVDSDGVIYFKNDSGYMFAVEKMQASISGITVTGGNAVLDEGSEFNGGVAAHTICYQSGTESLHLAVTAADDTTVYINDVKGAEQDVAIAGLSEITVKAENATGSREYTFTLREKSSDANLGLLAVNASNSFGTSMIFPEYDPDVYVYHGAYNTGKTFLNVWADPDEKHQTIEVKAVSGVKDKAEGEVIAKTATSGTHNRYAIYFADTTYETPAVVTVNVTSEDGTVTKSYQMTLSIDKVKPVLTVSESAVNSRSLHSAEIAYNISEDGKVYYSATATTAAAIKKEYTGAMAAAGDGILTIEGLGADAATYYLVAYDCAANTSSLLTVEVPAYDTSAADAVTAKIAELPATESMTLDDLNEVKAAVTAARDAYNALSADDQSLVTDLDTLTAAEAKVAELQAIKDKMDNLPFKDVSSGSWYHDAVAYVYAYGLMTGLDETTFGPSVKLSRAQFAVILWRMNGSPKMAYTAKFPDVKSSSWYTDAVLWASEKGVVTGYNNGKFGPADYITREQMALMMFRYAKALGYDTSTRASFDNFKDGNSVASFAKEAMSWAVAEGIITGHQNGTALEPRGYAVRAECATIIMRFCKKYSE